MNFSNSAAAVQISMPLEFRPFLRPQVWGGRALETLLGKTLPSAGPYGETWEICPLPAQESRVAAGPWAGVGLNELWATGELLASSDPSDGANRPSEPFPWLVKWLDCQGWLSVQVHPDAETSERWLGEICPKSEAWVVIASDPTARVYAGFQPGVTPDEVERRLRDGSILECLHVFHPQPGDCIYLPAGTVHASGGGLVVAEVQQPSDATFRLFDWNRAGTDGAPRKLHIEEALDSIHWPQGPVDPVTAGDAVCQAPGVECRTLLQAPEFQFDRFEVQSQWTQERPDFAVWMVLAGSGMLSGEGFRRAVSAGDTVLIPAATPHLDWEPTNARLSLLRVTLPVR